MAKLKSTNGTYPPPIRETRWVGIIFFIIIHLIAVIGTPWYLINYGITTPEIILFVFYMTMTGFSITVGYHRLFSHKAFKANNFVKFILLFFGGATFEQSALKWGSQHRQHHQFSDTDKDPYNINKGFWYAHMNWILLWKHRVNYDNVKDLQNDPLVMHQHTWYSIWSVFAGMLLPLIIGAMMGKLLGAFIMSLCLRMVIVMHSAFFINSFCHMFGSRPMDTTIHAADHWTGAFLTNGEGYHNFHHRFPSDYRNGYKWYHYDPTKWAIFLMAKLGMAWDLKRTSEASIEHALSTVKKTKTAGVS